MTQKVAKKSSQERLRPALTTNRGTKKDSEGGFDFYMIQNPQNLLGEYIIVSPEDYVEGKSYYDYLNIYIPIKSVNEAEKV